jgi:hypothetical protein
MGCYEVSLTGTELLDELVASKFGVWKLEAVVSFAVLVSV